MVGAVSGDETVTKANAMFAASAVARLARVLHEAGVIDDFLIGELAAVASESAEEAGSDEARDAMEVVRGQLDQLSRTELARQDALDEAQDAEDAADDA